MMAVVAAAVTARTLLRRMRCLMAGVVVCLMATPMRRSDFLLSFVLVRALMLVVEVPAILLFARFAFDVGESIHTENSYKYSVAEFRALAQRAGFSGRKLWSDGRGRFALHGLEA